jgi:hypothetical protein
MRRRSLLASEWRQELMRIDRAGLLRKGRAWVCCRELTALRARAVFYGLPAGIRATDQCYGSTRRIFGAYARNSGFTDAAKRVVAVVGTVDVLVWRKALWFWGVVGDSAPNRTVAVASAERDRIAVGRPTDARRSWDALEDGRVSVRSEADVLIRMVGVATTAAERKREAVRIAGALRDVGTSEIHDFTTLRDAGCFEDRCERIEWKALTRTARDLLPALLLRYTALLARSGSNVGVARVGRTTAAAFTHQYAVGVHSARGPGRDASSARTRRRVPRSILWTEKRRTAGILRAAVRLVAAGGCTSRGRAGFLRLGARASGQQNQSCEHNCAVMCHSNHCSQ